MAEKGVILSVDEEQKLLKPIDEYVGKIQKQIDALRADGSDKVRSFKEPHGNCKGKQEFN